MSYQIEDLVDMITEDMEERMDVATRAVYDLSDNFQADIYKEVEALVTSEGAQGYGGYADYFIDRCREARLNHLIDILASSEKIQVKIPMDNLTEWDELFREANYEDMEQAFIRLRDGIAIIDYTKIL